MAESKQPIFKRLYDRSPNFGHLQLKLKSSLLQNCEETVSFEISAALNGDFNIFRRMHTAATNPVLVRNSRILNLEQGVRTKDSLPVLIQLVLRYRSVPLRKRNRIRPRLVLGLGLKNIRQ